MRMQREVTLSIGNSLIEGFVMEEGDVAELKGKRWNRRKHKFQIVFKLMLKQVCSPFQPETDFFHVMVDLIN
jgi:hypothetical protein